MNAVTQDEIDAVYSTWNAIECSMLSAILLGNKPESFSFEVTIDGRDYEGPEAVRAFLDRYESKEALYARLSEAKRAEMNRTAFEVFKKDLFAPLESA